MAEFVVRSVVERYKSELFIAGVVAICVLVLVIAYEYHADSPYRLRALDAKAKLLRGEIRVVLDVRDDVEWWAGHYPGAIHVPVARLLLESPNALPNLSEPVLVYCKSGRRARHATDVLRALGYTRVWYIDSPYWSIL